MPAHSILGASSAKRWLNCPGSVRLSRNIPRRSSKYADEGTAAHELGEKCLRSGLDANAHLGASIDVEGTAWEITEDMVEAVQVYLDVVRADQTAHPLAELKVEQKFELDWLYDGLFGTNDASLVEPFGKLIVDDYKHGQGISVQIEEDGKPNPQLMYYALGAAHGQPVEEVELVIVQPRVQGEPVKRFTLSIEDLEAWGRDVLLPGALATEQPDAPLNAGKHCKFCPAEGICPEKRRQTANAARVKVDELGLPAPNSYPLAAGALNPAQLKRVLDFVDQIESWIKAARDYAYDRLKNGEEVPGYKLVETKGNRAWASPEDSIYGEMSLYVKNDDDLYSPRKLLSPAQMEKALKASGLKPKEAKEVVDSFVACKDGTAMVPEADKRPAIKPSLDGLVEWT